MHLVFWANWFERPRYIYLSHHICKGYYPFAVSNGGDDFLCCLSWMPISDDPDCLLSRQQDSHLCSYVGCIFHCRSSAPAHPRARHQISRKNYSSPSSSSPLTDMDLDHTHRRAPTRGRENGGNHSCSCTSPPQAAAACPSPRVGRLGGLPVRVESLHFPQEAGISRPHQEGLIRIVNGYSI